MNDTFLKYLHKSVRHPQNFSARKKLFQNQRKFQRFWFETKEEDYLSEESL